MSGELLGAALTYGLRGWRVVPLEDDGKAPRIKRWQLKASSDPATITGWWEKWPNANVGVAAGAASGIVVLDVDGDEGEATLAELEDKLGPLPETLEVATPSGGRHLWFQHPGGHVPNSASALGPGLDVRGDGGLVVVPPSGRPGGIWEWLGDPDDSGELAELPPAWAALLRVDQAPEAVEPLEGAGQRGTMPYGQTALDLEALEVAEAPEGERNTRLNLAAFRMGQLAAEDELNLNDAGNRLLEAAVYSGLPTHEAEQTIRSGLAAGMHHPRDPLSGSEKSELDEKSHLTSDDAPEEGAREVEESSPEAADSPLDGDGPTLSSRPFSRIICAGQRG
jgi:hypothetical protein